MDVFQHLSAAKNFAWSRERVSVFFAFNFFFAIVFGLLLLAVLGSVVKRFGALASGAATGAGSRLALSGGGALFLLGFIFLILAFGVLALLLTATFVKAAQEFFEERNPKPSLSKCFKQALNRFIPLVLAIILIIVVMFVISVPLMILSLLPVLGTLFALIRVLFNIVFTLAFAFVQYFVVIGGAGPVSGVVKSVELFGRKPVEVFLALLASMIAAAFIVIISAIPLAVVILVGIALLLASVKGAALVVLLLLLAAAIVVFLIGFSFFQVFNLGFLTSVFLELSGGQIASAPKPAQARAATPRGKRVGKRKRVKTRRA